jgi:ubiquinone/menaquinone biosynthesis C-methylase UbiE
MLKDNDIDIDIDIGPVLDEVHSRSGLVVSYYHIELFADKRVILLPSMESTMVTMDQKIEEFKRKVEQDWTTDETASAWQKYYPQMREQLADVTKALVDAADLQPGMNVLDLASGVGEPSLSVAAQVRPKGKVTATDLSSAMLSALRQNSDDAGIANLETRVVDAHTLPFPDSAFDRVTSRFGIMFFAEVDKALAEVRRVLKPGGKTVFMVWGKPEPGTYFAAVALPYISRMEVKPDPDGPGPMRFAEPGKLAKYLENAGFQDVQEQPYSLDSRFPGTPELLHTSMFEIAAPFRNIAASLSDDDRKAAETEVLNHLRPRFDGTHTTLKAPVIILTGVKP